MKITFLQEDGVQDFGILQIWEIPGSMEEAINYDFAQQPIARQVIRMKILGF